MIKSLTFSRLKNAKNVNYTKSIIKIYLVESSALFDFLFVHYPFINFPVSTCT